MKARILIVDDMASMRALIKVTLKQAGFDDLDEAVDGERAIEKLAKNDYDFLICDWNMPKLNGLEVLQQVRNEQRLRNLPFIMLTANANADHVRKAIDLGVTDYVSKPFKPETLLKKMHRHLKLKRI